MLCFRWYHSGELSWMAEFDDLTVFFYSSFLSPMFWRSMSALDSRVASRYRKPWRGRELNENWFEMDFCFHSPRASQVEFVAHHDGDTPVYTFALSNCVLNDILFHSLSCLFSLSWLDLHQHEMEFFQCVCVCFSLFGCVKRQVFINWILIRNDITMYRDGRIACGFCQISKIHSRAIIIKSSYVAYRTHLLSVWIVVLSIFW